MRTKLARDLVRFTAELMSRGFDCYWEGDTVGAERWAFVSKKVQKATLPLSRWLDRDASLDEMANQGWWG